MSKLNVLLITADHWPAQLLGSAGHPCIETPTLDELARCGVRYTNAYSECPVCIPARRTLLTGMSPQSHGDRIFQTTLRLPEVTTIAQAFRNGGYQAYAVGKLHVFPQRERAGFDDVLLAEEGRPHWGVWDDYDIFLGDQGFVGRQFDHGMSNNQYAARPWHLPESCHVTHWAAREMSKVIRRRDPTRPGFWHLSFTHPHPPLTPPQHYWDIYQQKTPPSPPHGAWAPLTWSAAPNGGDESLSEADPDAAAADRQPAIPFRLQQQFESFHVRQHHEVVTALRAFYALCTHIDHQIRLVLGTLREEGLLDDTLILFSADHGDMLGAHGLWAKRLFYEGSANVPMILVGPKSQSVIEAGTTDDRLVGWQDIMPSLLKLAGCDVPASCDGRSIVDGARREYLYGECNEGKEAARMIHDGRYKLLYYPAGNVTQLFDLANDPNELNDLSGSEQHSEVRQRLTDWLLESLYGSDQQWLNEQQLVGLPAESCPPLPNRGLALQRGIHWPPPPVRPPRDGETNPGTN